MFPNTSTSIPPARPRSRTLTSKSVGRRSGESNGAAYYHCSLKSLLHPHGKNNHPRQLLLYLAAIYCRDRHTLSEMAELLGPISLSGLGNARERVKSQLRESPQLRAEVAQLEALLAEKCKTTPEDKG
jgi:hypothetical protein